MCQITKKKIWISLFGLALSASVSAKTVAPETKNAAPPVSNSPYVLKNKDLESVLPKQALDWIEVVKRNNPELNCPQISSGASCLFIGSVSIDEENGEYQITLKGSSFIDGYVNIPTLSRISSQEENAKIWIKKILVNGKDAEMIEQEDKLMAAVNKGDFDLKLIVSKSQAKDLASIYMENTPLILTNNIKNKNFIKDGNIIRLAEKTVISENNVSNTSKINSQDELQINVFRKIHTQIPNVLSTKIKIIYSGKPKDFYLGKVLPEGFEFNAASSNLKIEKKEDGFWVKLIAGESNLNIESFILKNISAIKVDGLITSATNEVWSLQQESSIRQIEVISNTQVDPKQAMVPEEWVSLPAYLVKNDFNIKDNRRGLEENKNIDITFNRTSFFGFNKNEMFHLEHLNVKNYGIQFLNKNGSDVLPESFKINEQNQVLLSSDKKLGVIVPKGEFQATTQAITKDSTIPVQFWDGKTSISQWVINLAPRMKMFAITGDSIKSYGTWLDNWNLYVVFSVFLIVLTFYKLFGKTTAIMAFIGLMLFQDEVFSWALWLTILFVLGLQKILPDQSNSQLTKAVNAIGFSALGLFIFYTINFIKKEIQLMINPSLELIAPSLNIINPSNYIIHLAVVTVIVYLLNGSKKQEEDKAPISFVKIGGIIFAACIVISVVSSLLGTSKETLFGTGATSPQILAENAQLRTLDAVPAPAAPMPMESKITEDAVSLNSLSSYRNAKEFNKAEVVDNIILKKAQVGSGIPNWQTSLGISRGNVNRYSIESTEAIKKESNVHFWIAPVWMINILSLIQIAFLLMSIFLFTIGVLHLSNREDWFNKIPHSIRRNKLVQILLINDLKKGFLK
jgi:hypothetical protein